MKRIRLSDGKVKWKAGASFLPEICIRMTKNVVELFIMTPRQKMWHVLLPLVFLLLLLATLLDVAKVSLEPVWERQAYSLRDGWTLIIEGETVDTDFSLPTVLGGGSLYGKHVVLSHLIPENVPHLNSLMIRTSQKTVSIQVDGHTVYTYDGNLADRRLRMPGYITHFAWLGDDAAGKLLSIETISHSARTSGTFYEVFLGSRTSQVGELFRYDGFSLVLGLLILMTAGAVALLSVTLFRNLDIRRSALSFAGIEACVGLWLCSGSMSTQLLVHNQLYLLISGVVAMFLLPVFLTWFVSSMYHLPQSRVLDRMVLLFPFAFTVVSALQLGGRVSYLDVLTPGAIALFAYLVVLVWFSVRSYRRGNRSISSFLVAVACLLASVIGEMILLMLPFMTLVNALVLNLGIVAFGTVLLRQVLLQVMRFIEKKGRDEYLETLVHLDGLTGLANRRAFDEHMERLREHPGSAGMIIFDVNDLKKLNDEQGHAAGDAMLKQLANRLLSWFGSIGTVYRIGGDEFAMICDDCSSGALSTLTMEIEAHLLAEDSDRYDLAFGYASVDPESNLASIDDVFRAADSRMYQHKLAVKTSAIR